MQDLKIHVDAPCLCTVAGERSWSVGEPEAAGCREAYDVSAVFPAIRNQGDAGKACQPRQVVSKREVAVHHDDVAGATSRQPGHTAFNRTV